MLAGCPRLPTSIRYLPCSTTDSYDAIQWGSDSTQLYAVNNSGGGDFYALTVNSLGVTLRQDYGGVFWNPGRIHFNKANGLIYSDDGFHAIHPSTGLPTGIFEVAGRWLPILRSTRCSSWHNTFGKETRTTPSISLT